ncbi:universal stress protein [Nocardioides caldifontis]|uniref:universal stress protein n=1 Tax=Nocardioides caldifontis TaxID=2588938 RepID=UPI001396902D|nr:universal stress protein [Nocardioides caldifontis]
MTSTSSSRKVVVAYDGSPDADLGLDWAVEHARARHLSLEVLAAWGDLTYLPERASSDAEPLVRSWLDRAAARLETAGATDWTTTATAEKVVPELLERSRDASMVVLGARGHSLIGGMLLGSVSQHVTRHAACPVVVVRGHTPLRRRVVVGVDGSQGARRALELAFEEADRTGSTLVAVHGMDVSAVHGPWDVTVAPHVAEEIDAGRRLLAEAVAGHREQHPDVEVELLAVPVPAVRALADASSTASLVVVGTRGRGGFVGLLLGSVSATVLQHATCPVMVVR